METDKLLFKFISEVWGPRDLKKINDSTTLSDIGLYGDDKMEFLKKFFRRFDIEYTNFDWAKYIEPEINTFNIRGIIKFFKKKPISNYPEISIGDLIKAIENKKWFKD